MKKLLIISILFIPTLAFAGGHKSHKPKPIAPNPPSIPPQVAPNPTPSLVPSVSVTSAPSQGRQGGHRHQIDNTYLKIQLIDLMQQLVVLLRKKQAMITPPSVVIIHDYKG